MQLNDIAMIAADTSRSRAYLQSLVRHDLMPNHILVLNDATNKALPGQLEDPQSGPNEEHDAEVDECWSEVNFDLTQPIKAFLDDRDIPYEVSTSRDINAPSVVAAISRRTESVFIYSGFGGVILRKNVLATGMS